MNNDPTRLGTIVLGNLAAFEDHAGESYVAGCGGSRLRVVIMMMQVPSCSQLPSFQQ